MVVHPYTGTSIKDDLAAIPVNLDYHDAIIVCADGVCIDVNRAILAARSVVLYSMLVLRAAAPDDPPDDANTRTVITLRDIDSAAMHVVLAYIHTDNVLAAAVADIAFDVYRAASFFRLPRLMTLVLQHVHNSEVFGPVPLLLCELLLNNTALHIPWSEPYTDLYDLLFKPFCTQPLTLGDLNSLSPDALATFLTYTNTPFMSFATSEYDLLLCVIDWAWSRLEQTPPPGVRHDILQLIDVTTETHSPIQLGDEQACSSLLHMLPLLDLTLICPHRLRALTMAVDALTIDDAPHHVAFRHHACKNTRCPPGHPSAYRGRVWDRPDDDIMSEDSWWIG